MNLIDRTQIILKLIIPNFTMNSSVVGVCLLLVMNMILVRSQDCCLEKTVSHFVGGKYLDKVAKNDIMKVTGSDPALSGTYRYVKVTPSGEYPAECQDGCTYLKAWLYSRYIFLSFRERGILC